MPLNPTSIAISVIALFFASNSYAQPQKGEFIKVLIGAASAVPYETAEVSSSGILVQGEYVFAVERWFSIRPYAGVVIASGESAGEVPGAPLERMKSNAALLGAKVRLAIPLKYVAPYAELGYGFSVGSFETTTPKTDFNKSGLFNHVPFAFGLAVGKKNRVDVEFTFYSIARPEQLLGAVAIGYTFPFKTKTNG